MAIWSCLQSCGACCMCLSVWAIVQLSFMGVFYYIETPILIEDVEAHHPESFDQFIKDTRKNYHQNALNCWTVAAIYAVTLLLSLFCMSVSNKKLAEADRKLRDEDWVCGVSGLPRIQSVPMKKEKSPVKKKKVKSEKIKNPPKKG